MKHLLCLLVASLLPACASPPTITPDPLADPKSQGQALLLPPVGYCTEYTGGCAPDDATARGLCARQYGDPFSTAMECWQSNEAVDWGCVPLCGVSIACNGAEVPSALWCCPW